MNASVWLNILSGGTATNTCASGFGVCCIFSGGCGGQTSINNTYFKVNSEWSGLTSANQLNTLYCQSTGSDSSSCTLKVCKSGPDVCQLRLNFDTFVAAQPLTTEVMTSLLYHLIIMTHHCSSQGTLLPVAGPSVRRLSSEWARMVQQPPPCVGPTLATTW